MKSHYIFAALTALAASPVSAKDYASFGIEVGTAKYASYEFVNPRITGLVQDNNSSDTTSLSLAYGRTYPEFRGEIELNLGSRGTFTSYHSPFNTFAQVKEVNSNRLMANFIRDLDVGYRFKPYLTAGVGIAMNTAEGFQGPLRNSFEKKTTYALAYSLGLGAQMKITPRSKFDVSYRYINAGDASTGGNQFGLYDEQYKGKFITNAFRAVVTYELK